MKFKVGDLVDYKPQLLFTESYESPGIILNISRSGTRAHHAQILFNNREPVWISFKSLKKMEDNESNSF